MCSKRMSTVLMTVCNGSLLNDCAATRSNKIRISRMMASRGSSNDQMDHKESIYQKAEAYWARVSCDVDGMLGGFAHLHAPDIYDSKKFIRHLKTKGLLTKFDKAVDCGCGIGRVTKHLLLPLFHTVDMVDVTQNFIQESAKYLGEEEDQRVGRKLVCGLQNFEPPPECYDLIWVQWVAGHLTDPDLCQFLQRCKVGLREGGCIVLKENVMSSSSKEAEGKDAQEAETRYDFDEEDNSWTRPRAALVRLVQQAGLAILARRKQRNFPKGMLSVYMFALK